MLNEFFSYNLKLSGYLITNAVNAFNELYESKGKYTRVSISSKWQELHRCVAFTKQN